MTNEELVQLYQNGNKKALSELVELNTISLKKAIRFIGVLLNE